MGEKKRTYNINVIEGRQRGKKQWRIVLKFPNGKIFMHSEYYVNEIYAKKAAEKLYQVMKKGWGK